MEIPIDLLLELKKSLPKFVWNSKEPRVAETVLNNRQGTSHARCQDI